MQFLNAPNEDSDQSDQCLRWAHMSKGMFSRVVAHLYVQTYIHSWYHSRNSKTEAQRQMKPSLNNYEP